MMLDYPFVTETDAKAQVQQLKGYLCQMVDSLNRVLSALEEKDAALAKSIEAIASDAEVAKQAVDEQNQYTMQYIDGKTKTEGV